MDEAQSRRIAGLLGPTMIVMIVSEFALVQPRLYNAQIPPVVYLSGVLMFVAGLAIVRLAEERDAPPRHDATHFEAGERDADNGVQQDLLIRLRDESLAIVEALRQVGLEETWRTAHDPVSHATHARGAGSHGRHVTGATHRTD